MKKKTEMKLVHSKGTRVLDEHLESLPVQLTTEEVLARSKSLVRLRDEERKAEAEFSEAKESYKKVTAGINVMREHLEQAIRDERELRSVKVQSVAHYETCTLKQTRVDTGHVVNERALLPEEMQFNLELDNEEGEVSP